MDHSPLIDSEKQENSNLPPLEVEEEIDDKK